MTIDERLSNDVQQEARKMKLDETEEVIPLQRCPHLYIKYTPEKGKVAISLARNRHRH